MVRIMEVNDANEKSDFYNPILRSLANWFNVVVSIIDNVQQVKNLLFIAAYTNDAAHGFVTL